MRIFVAGRTGLVGQAVTAAARARGHELVEPPYVDFRDRRAVEMFWYEHSIELADAVVLAAARVGGIGANAANPIDFFLDNMRISTNLIELAAMHEMALINLGSSCVYPRECHQPMREQDLFTGPFEPTNVGYAMAKVAALQLTELYRQDGHLFTSLMPTNLYGPGDTYDEFTSHVIPALIMKFCRAVDDESPCVTLWGSGTALREFMHVEDLAAAILLLLEGMSGTAPDWMNVGSGEEISIAGLARTIADLCGYAGEILWDDSRPDGSPRKLLDSTRIRSMGWSPSISLEDGLRRTIAAYRGRGDSD